jgi:thiamine kinase-like enzyme
MESSLLPLLQRHFQSYCILTPSELKLSPLRGSFKTLYKIESKFVPSPIIYREFRESSLIPPELERRNFEMVAKAGLGPKCLASTSAYRLEEFIPGRQILRNQSEEIMDALVPSLSAFHSIANEACEPVTFGLIRQWTLMLQTEAQIYLSCLEGEQKQVYEEILEAVGNEREIVELMPKTNATAFLHGDCFYGNIIFGKQKYWFVDYEYSEMGHPSIDLANFIMESMFEYNENRIGYFPESEISLSAQMDFVEKYADSKGIDSEDLWNDVCRAKAIVNCTKMLWAACSYRPHTEYLIDYAKIRLELFRRFKNSFE